MRTEEANRLKDEQVFSHLNTSNANLVMSNEFPTKEKFKSSPEKGQNSEALEWHETKSSQKT